MPIQPMLLVETSSRDKRAAKFAHQGTPVFAVIRSSVHLTDKKVRTLKNYGFLLTMITLAILLNGDQVYTFLLGFTFAFTVTNVHYQIYALEFYESYQRKRNEMIGQRRVVELPREMLDAWQRAFGLLGINVSASEARMEFGRLCHDPHTRERLVVQRRLLIRADCDPCHWVAISNMRNEMSAILRDHIRDRQIDTRPGRL